MIVWSIRAALESVCFDRVLVSTDDAEIAAIGQQYGAQAPFVRPAELSDDTTATTPVIAHAINWLAAHGEQPEQVCCIYATAPFLRPQDLNQGLQMLTERNCDFVFSATSYGYPIQRAFRLKAGARVEMLDPTQFSARSQDLEEVFHDAGQFYWGTRQAWLSGRPIFSGQATALVIPRYRVQDIDTPDDWIRAELMFSALKNYS